MIIKCYGNLTCILIDFGFEEEQGMKDRFKPALY